MKRYRSYIRGVAFERGDLCSSLEKRGRVKTIGPNYGSRRGAGYLVYVNFLMNCGSQQTLAAGDRIRAPDGERDTRGRTLERLRDDSLAGVSLEVRVEECVDRRACLTPDSPERAIVLEHMPLHASQNRISWS
jgi:hypothetical protein